MALDVSLGTHVALIVFAMITMSHCLTIGDFVWNDKDMDGLQTCGEYGIGGVQVDLWQNGQKIGSTTSAPSGYYSFQNLVSGTYYVDIVLPAGGGNSVLAGAIPTVVVPNSVYTTSVGVLQPGGTDSKAEVVLTSYDDLSVDFGFSYLPVVPWTIGDQVFDDQNHDGMQDDGEYGIPGVSLDLLDSTGTVVDNTFTDPQGKYSFGLSRNGQYTARVQLNTDANPHLTSFTLSPLADFSLATSKALPSIDTRVFPALYSAAANFVLLGSSDLSINFGLMEPTSPGYALPTTSALATLLSQTLSQLDIFLAGYSLSIVSINNVTAVDANTVSWTITLNSVGTNTLTPQLICKYLRNAIANATSLPTSNLVTGCTFNSLRKRVTSQASSTFVFSGYIWIPPGFRGNSIPDSTTSSNPSSTSSSNPSSTTPNVPANSPTKTTANPSTTSDQPSNVQQVKKNSAGRQAGSFTFVLCFLSILWIMHNHVHYFF